jgi:hypothetical protein
MTTARVIVSLLVATSGLAFLGCADDPAPNTDSNVLANVDPSVTPQWSPVIVAGKCPDPKRGSTEKTEYYQAKATRVIQFLVGGKDPFSYEDITYNSACKDAQINLTNLRNMIAPYSSKISPTATLQMATSGTVCGLSASLYALDISLQVPTSVWEAQQKTGDQLDLCWGYGVSGFYYADPDWQENKNHRIFIDPEPARLVKDLFGLTGATAAAVYSNTYAEVDVIKYPGSWVNPASPPTPGQPCSTSDLPNGTETLKILQGSGTWRRCY